MAYGKTPACFFVFLHFYPFLLIPVFWYLFPVLLFIPLFPFRDPITSQTEHFWVDFFAQKTSPFKFPIGVPSRDPPKMFKMNSFKWKVVYTIALHSSTDQSKNSFFICWISRIWLLRKFFCQKIWNTKMAYGKTPVCFFDFLHFYPLLFIPVFDFYSVSPLHSSVSLPGSNN